MLTANDIKSYISSMDNAVMNMLRTVDLPTFCPTQMNWFKTEGQSLSSKSLMKLCICSKPVDGLDSNIYLK